MSKRREWYADDGRRWCSGCQDYRDARVFGRRQTSHVGDGLDIYCAECRRYQSRKAERKRRGKRRTWNAKRAAYQRSYRARWSRADYVARVIDRERRLPRHHASGGDGDLRCLGVRAIYGPPGGVWDNVEMSEHWCAGCRAYHPQSAFWRDALAPGGLSRRCKACVRAKRVARRQHTKPVV